jgi:biopolymer transport protein ExbB/TolQ
VNIEDILFHISEALRVPVLVLALVAVALVLVEAGAFTVELLRRRRRSFPRLQAAADRARGELRSGNPGAASATLYPVAWSTSMDEALRGLVLEAGSPDPGNRMAKRLADFDFASIRRLERTRLLVRFGPALGLAGTLIPLTPALAGLASGDVQSLSDNLRVAFSVTVVGLLVGAVAFGLSLVRDRLYGQDLSDLEYVAAVLVEPEAAAA